MKIGEIVGIYVAWVVLTNACLGRWDPPQFLQGQKTAIMGNIFDQVLKWRLTIPQIGKSKTILFITDYLTFTGNLIVVSRTVLENR